MNIIDPENKQLYSLKSVQGKHTLKQYIKFYQKGGHFVEVSKEMLKNCESFGTQTCAANAFNWIGHGIYSEMLEKLILIGRQSELNIPNADTHLITDYKIMMFVNLIEDLIRKVDKKITNQNYKRIIKDTRKDAERIPFEIKNITDARKVYYDLKRKIPKGSAGFLTIDWRSGDGHIVCVYHEPRPQFSDSILTVIELQSKRVLRGKKNVVPYLIQMEQCYLIVGALTLKSPAIYEQINSSTNHPNQTNFERSINRAGSSRKSIRLQMNRAKAEAQAEAQAQEAFNSFREQILGEIGNPDLIKNANDRTERALKRSMQKEENEAQAEAQKQLQAEAQAPIEEGEAEAEAQAQAQTQALSPAAVSAPVSGPSTLSKIKDYFNTHFNTHFNTYFQKFTNLLLASSPRSTAGGRAKRPSNSSFRSTRNAPY